MEMVATALVLLVLVSLGGLVVLPALPLLLRSRGRWGRLGRTIALCGAAFFLTWCVVPIFVFPSGEVTVGMTMFALYGAMIQALVVAVAAAVASYGD
jgi:4-amino-4-deoxy-L-arabinose transferase-like glycosyltransferase